MGFPKRSIFDPGAASRLLSPTIRMDIKFRGYLLSRISQTVSVLGALCVSMLAIALCSFLIAEKIPYSPHGYVNDFANMLTPSARQQVEAVAAELAREKQVELAVVTVTSIGDRSAEDYALDLFAQWGIGKKGLNTGLLLLIAKNERQIRIEVGYGLEEKVTDAVASEVYRAIRERFRAGDYEGGILMGAQMLSSAVGGTLQLPSRSRRARARSGSPALGVIAFFVAILFFLAVVNAIIGRNGRGGRGMSSSIPWWLLLLASRSSGRGGWSAWDSGGFSGGHGGFGGFGGGLSGGGGAGGSW